MTKQESFFVKPQSLFLSKMRQYDQNEMSALQTGKAFVSYLIYSRHLW